MRFRFLFICLSLCCVIQTMAQRFSSSLLQQSAKALGLESLSSLPEGYSSRQHNGVKLSFVRHGDRIDHIGRYLFPEALRELNPLPVYDYLEFAWLEQSLLHNDNPFKYKDVFFCHGDWKALAKVDDSTPCQVLINDGLNYNVIWSLTDGSCIEVTFPVSYEIVSTAARGELERNLIEDLSRHSVLTTDDAVLPDESRLQFQPDSSYLLMGDIYLLPTINNDTYYTKTSDQGGYALICDTLSLQHTLSNMVMANAFPTDDWILHILFSLHEKRVDTLTVSLPSFVDCLKHQGCQLYWGFESQEEDKITGTLFAYNSNSGYNHVFRITCPIGRVRHLSCSASLYVPTTNIRDLHMQYTPKNDREKIKWK